MILPTKHVHANRALIGVGGEVLQVLKRPRTISSLWDEVRGRRTLSSTVAPLDYEWFVLSLDFLYLIGAIRLDRGLVRRAVE